PPPPPEPPAAPYVGLWAAKRSMCPDGAWVFAEKQLTTAGEVACQFEQVRSTAEGFQVVATCSAEDRPKPYQFSLEMASGPQPKTMTVTRGPWNGPVRLVRCPTS
ncbi:MAG TPA: hypothetical protein VIO94_12125, partial [Phenylobacterium sp.]